MNRTTSLSRHDARQGRPSPTWAATAAAVMSCGAAACALGIAFMNTHDVLGYDAGQTPGAYLVYMLMLIGVVCAPFWGAAALATYAWQRRHSDHRIVRSDVLVSAAFVVLAFTIWRLPVL